MKSRPKMSACSRCLTLSGICPIMSDRALSTTSRLVVFKDRGTDSSYHTSIDDQANNCCDRLPLQSNDGRISIPLPAIARPGAVQAHISLRLLEPIPEALLTVTTVLEHKILRRQLSRPARASRISLRGRAEDFRYDQRWAAPDKAGGEQYNGLRAKRM